MKTQTNTYQLWAGRLLAFVGMFFPIAANFIPPSDKRAVFFLLGGILMTVATVIEREMHSDTVRVGTATYRTTYKKQIDAEGNIDYTGRYNLINTDNDLLVGNETAYLVTPRGSRFYAPQSAFTTAQGYTFYIESGKVLRMESPPEIVYVDTDDLTR